MANFLDEFRQFNNKELALIIALIDNIGIGNVAKLKANKTIGKILGVTNSIFEPFNGKPLEYSRIDDLAVDVRIKSLEYMEQNSEVLFDMLIKKVIVKLQASENVKLEKLSLMAVYEAARLYKLDENLIPSLLCDNVYKKFKEEYINSIHKKLSREDAKAIKESDEKIFNSIIALSYNERTAIKNSLNIPDFSEKSISKSLRGPMGVRMIGILTGYIGYEIFDESNVLLDILYRSVTSVLSPERIIMAFLIFKAINKRGAFYTATDDQLPGYVFAREKGKEEQEEKEFRHLVCEYKEINNRIADIELAIKKHKDDRIGNLDTLNKLYAKRDTYKKNYDSLVFSVQDYANQIEKNKREIEIFLDNNQVLDRSDSRYKNMISESKELARKEKTEKKALEKCELEIKNYYKTVKELEQKSTNLERDIEKLQDRLIDQKEILVEVKKRYLHALDMEFYKLKTHWITCFLEVTFEEHVLKNVVCEFSRAEILNIERAIMELINAGDITLYSNAKVKNKDTNLMYMTFVPKSNSLGIIVYTKPVDSSKLVFIADILRSEEQK